MDCDRVVEIVEKVVVNTGGLGALLKPRGSNSAGKGVEINITKVQARGKGSYAISLVEKDKQRITCDSSANNKNSSLLLLG